MKKNAKKFGLKLKINLWTIIFGIFLFLFVAPFILSFFDSQNGKNRVELSQALIDIKEEKVDKVVVENDNLILTYKDGTTKLTSKEPNETFTDLLEKSQIAP